MAKYIIRRKSPKRIFEEGEALATPQQAQTAAAPAPAAGTPAPQGQAQAAAPAAQPANNTATPANAAAPAPAAQGNNNNQQQAQPQQQEQQAQPSEKETKVTECINQINATVQKNDPYVLLALNIPDLIKQSLPDFANAPEAKDTMGKWEAFKKTPSAETFKNFTDAFVAYGKGGQEGQAQQQQQQAPAQDAVAQHNESVYRAFTFSQRLNEKLQHNLKISNAAKSFDNYKPFDF